MLRSSRSRRQTRDKSEDRRLIRRHTSSGQERKEEIYVQLSKGKRDSLSLDETVRESTWRGEKIYAYTSNSTHAYRTCTPTYTRPEDPATRHPLPLTREREREFIEEKERQITQGVARVTGNLY